MIEVLVLVDHALGISGPHRNVVSTLNALTQRNDLRVTLLCSKIDKNERYYQCGRLQIFLGFDPHNPRKILTNIALLRKAVKSCHLIYVPTGLKSFLYAFFLKRKRPLVAGPNVTGLPIFMNMANPSPLMTMKMADAWIEMSDVRIEQCVRAGTPRNYINLIPHAIDTNRFHPSWRDQKIWEKEKIPKGALKVIYVGRMNHELKGIPQLIESFLLIQKRIPNVRMILIGKPGKFITESDLNLPGVHFLGPRYGEELAILYASADLFIGSSRYETFWFTPLEAMASGLPVVVSRVGAVPTMIPKDGVQGKIVDIVDNQQRFLPNAAQILAEAAIPLLWDRDKRVRMGQAARKQVQTFFTEARLGEQLAAVFHGVLE